MVNVHKFGGILRDAQGYTRSAELLKKFGPGQVAVVSALYGVTDELDRAARNSSANHVDEFAQTLLQKHLALLEPIQSADIQKEASAALIQKINRLSKILFGIQLLEELTPTRWIWSIALVNGYRPWCWTPTCATRAFPAGLGWPIKPAY